MMCFFVTGILERKVNSSEVQGAALHGRETMQRRKTRRFSIRLGE